MKSIISICIVCVVVALLSGCASPYPAGALYTGVKLPVDVTSNKGKADKVGKASCISVLSLIAAGDASIEAAKKDGGITEVYHVDWEAQNFLGIFGNYTVTVYGK